MASRTKNYKIWGNFSLKVALPLEVEMGVMSLLFLLAGAVLGWMRAPVAERFRGRSE